MGRGNFVLGFFLGFLACAIVAVAFIARELSRWNNAIVLHDPYKQVAAATVVYGSNIEPLRRQEADLFVDRIGGDGSLQVRCHNGKTEKFGYVTANMRAEYLIDEECNPNRVPSPSLFPVN